MLSELPPVHLLFDLGALLVGKTREWQEFSRVGQCFLPQVVYDELLALANTESHPQKKTAQEFLRFLSGSNWQLTRATASHAQLQPLPEQHLGKRSRLALSVTESAYGTARGSVGRMVVLVSNDQASLRRVQDLKVPNLTGLPVSAVLIWGRTDRRPAVVVQHMHEMVERSRAFASASRRSNTAVATRSTATITPTHAVPNLRQSPVATRPSVLPQILSSVSSVLALALAVGLVWYLIQPTSFNQFLKHNNLPTVPQLPGSK
jgi:hypothetical protein